ncbi:hypothetical protein [Desulforamulus hydrothermalis]|uniref:hypothetical protein n=1 Tax=Desulforamulus hydrothermalis TaxID=412895 RepID=UPI001F46F1B6|nr:hypothetical protein [Desulforamulus hydrothermalis]
MIPFGSGLRTDSTMIRSGRPWGRLKRAILARFGWRPHPVGAPPNGSFRSSSAVTGASTSRRQGIIKPPHFVSQPLSTVWDD